MSSQVSGCPGPLAADAVEKAPAPIRKQHTKIRIAHPFRLLAVSSQREIYAQTTGIAVRRQHHCR